MLQVTLVIAQAAMPQTSFCEGWILLRIIRLWLMYVSDSVGAERVPLGLSILRSVHLR